MRILVPVDGSALSQSAIAYAEDIARGCGQPSQLVLLTVGEAVDDLEAPGKRAELERRLNERIAALRDVEGIGYFAVDGEPARVIADAIREKDVDLVVMATHRRRGVSKMMFGSVSEDVLDAVNVPAILVRPGVVPGEPEPLL